MRSARFLPALLWRVPTSAVLLRFHCRSFWLRSTSPVASSAGALEGCRIVFVIADWASHYAGQAIFSALSNHFSTYLVYCVVWCFACCRVESLPLVCKRWSETLKRPSSIWNHVQVKFPTHYENLKSWLKVRAPSIRSLRIMIDDVEGNKEQESSLLIGSLIQCAIDHTTLRDLYIVGGNKLYMDCEKWLPDLKDLEHLYLEEINPDHKHFFPSWFLHMNKLVRLKVLEIRGDEYVMPYSGPTEYRALPPALASMSELQRLSLQNLGICAFSEEEFTDQLVLAVSTLHSLRYIYQSQNIRCNFKVSATQSFKI